MLGAVAVDISAGGRESYQIRDVTEETADIITDVPGTAGGGVQGLLHQQKKGRC